MKRCSLCIWVNKTKIFALDFWSAASSTFFSCPFSHTQTAPHALPFSQSLLPHVPLSYTAFLLMCPPFSCLLLHVPNFLTQSAPTCPSLSHKVSSPVSLFFIHRLLPRVFLFLTQPVFQCLPLSPMLHHVSLFLPHFALPYPPSYT